MKLFTKAIKLTVLFFALLPTFGYAQLNGSYILSGKVNDDAGHPLVGASVLIKGTTNGTSTDTAGRFSLTSTISAQLNLHFSRR